MIQLTRLNNHPLVVNSDLIKFVEQAPDTVITLLSGEKIVVRESAPGCPRTRWYSFAARCCKESCSVRRSAPPVLENVAEGIRHPAGEE